MVPEAILRELESIKKELHFIKEHMADKDMFLDAEDRILLQQSLENERKGKLLTSAQLRNELGI